MPKAPVAVKKRNPYKLAVRLLVWGAVLAGMAWGSKRVESFLIRDTRFALHCVSGSPNCANLEIRGAVYANRNRIQNVFTNDFGKSLVTIPLSERRRHLLAIDWIRSASLMRVWPDRLVVTVSERRPVAFAKLPLAMGRYRMTLIDGDGVLLSIPSHARFRLPVLSGISEEQSEEERQTRVRAMQHLLEDLGDDSKQVSEINASSVQDLRLVAEMGGRAVDLWIGDQHYRTRFSNFLNHYEQIRKNSERATVFDLRLDDRISAR